MSRASIPIRPDTNRGRHSAREPAEPHTPLRLTVSRGALGIELYEPVRLGPLEVTTFSWLLPRLRFPVDLSGGVPVFRHRRGDLERLELKITRTDLERWLEPRLDGLLGRIERPVRLGFSEQGIAVCVMGTEGALAFDLLWAPQEGDARFVVCNARGAWLRGPALGYALRAVDSALGRVAQRQGRVFSLPRTAALIGRAVIPELGARAPATERARFGSLVVKEDTLRAYLDASFAPPLTTGEAARALGLADLLREGDEALACGELESARAAYLVALEHAPRHPEIARLVAEIDLAAGGRAEAALALLVESMPAVRAGWVGAELLWLTGDQAGARAALQEAAQHEATAPLAALLWLRLAERAEDCRERLEALDQAVVRAPMLERVRWARFQARVELGDVERALADAQHLEAGCSSARARHEVCVRAGRELLEQGFVHEARKLFERALRYLPDDPRATYGLSRALSAAGQPERAFALLVRARELGERLGQADARVLLDLGCYFARHLHDLPQAIARVREISANSELAPEARWREARWREQLGDLIGASQAFLRMRESIELSTRRDPAWSSWLLEAARFEREVHHDLLAAERHLSRALALSPHDQTVARAYREVSTALCVQARLARARGQPAAGGQDTPEPPGAILIEEETSRVPGGGEDAPLGGATESLDQPEPQSQKDQVEEEIARLEAKIRASPDNLELVVRLVTLLEQVGRDHELLALVSARLEEGGPEERARLLPHAEQVLRRLRDEACNTGRQPEAEVYAATLERLRGAKQ